MKQQLYKLLGIGLWVLFGCLAWQQPCAAQDIQFSDLNRTPLQVNAAQTGNFDGKIRVLAGYRNQWSQVLRSDAYITQFLSVENRLLSDEKQTFSLGISAARDASGELQSGSRSLKLSAAYDREIISTTTADHSIIIGLEGGWVSRNIYTNTARWTAQHIGSGEFSNVDPSGELLNRQSTLDLNGGLIWKSIFHNGNTFYLGAATHHLNKPSVSLLTDEEVTLTVRYAIHGSGEFYLSEKYSFIPSFLFSSQGNVWALSTGSFFRKYLGPPTIKSITGGLLVNAGNDIAKSVNVIAVTPVFSLDFDRLSIGLSYDLPISDYRLQGSFNGGAELTVGYIFGTQQLQNIVPVPEY